MRKRQLTTLAGTLFLIWFLFTPILALYLVGKLFPDSNILSFLLAIVLFYVLLGMIYYRICYYFGGVFLSEQKPIILSEKEYSEVKPDHYRGILEFIILLAAAFAFRPVLFVASIAPVLFGIIGLFIFIFVCLANWYKPLRARANFWLSFGEKNQTVSIARAESTLYTLNALLVTVSGYFILFASIYLFK